MTIIELEQQKSSENANKKGVVDHEQQAQKGN